MNSTINPSQPLNPLYNLYVDALDIGNAIYTTAKESTENLLHENPIRILQKSCKISAYYQEVKFLYSVVNILAIEQLRDLSNSFKMLMDMLLALMVVDNFTKMIEGFRDPNAKNIKDRGVVWYKSVSNILRFVASILDVALILEKYVGVWIPVYTDVRENMADSEFVQSFDSALLINLINKPKDLVIFIDSLWNIGVQAVLFLSGDEKYRAQALKPKTVLDTAGNIGKMLLITFGPGYYMTIAFRITAVVIAIIALVKQFAYD